MSEFKYIVGQELVIRSKDRNLNGKIVKVTVRGTGYTDSALVNWYKVTGEGIHGSLSFFEDQLEVTRGG